ncbi:non-ribosomal peptide synthetase/type I polyketide synthase [Paenibacillus aquistagni]|uniref:non-ribosomal peptide synthetase/type I polyketide synthase n=1 Tax=Paenibacillus aquistagni TaxID=1852522 RepID=UPI00145B7DCF|nr:non-ribosomal peptide synthetase/type I polyketide synthase [Paenibacillus aquistagni]NMM55488.1 amino acid adenylation domain-containing protein [Paenibacillus aquistagni]
MENSYSGYEVAIIGMAGRFSDTIDLQDFWEKLKLGTELITEFSDEALIRLGADAETIKKKDYVKVFGLLNDKDKFDAAFFGYTPHEARMMTPSMRIMHETVWEGLEDSGYIPDEYPGKIGLYLASSSSAYWESLKNFSISQEHFASFSASTYTVKDQIAARISYNLNLRGPSFILDTACSSSLVAVHLACQAILAGECDISVAGGVYISLNRDKGYVYQEGDIYSPDGHCRAFDAGANGTAKGEGVGVVVLKALDQAIADGDNIYAVIRGTAINNDGRMKVGYTSSSISGQADVVQSALLASDIQDPGEITYVETHGTGTNMGDPVEIHALEKAFSSEKKQFCRIGSVKSNIGHTIHAAGIAGLIKTALSLKHRIIPPTINYTRPNPNIDFENSPFIVNDTLTKWTGPFPLRAGVSSFGIGGTNAHAVLEEAPDSRNVKRNIKTDSLYVISAKTEEAFYGQINKLQTFIGMNPDLLLDNAAYTSQIGRKAFDYRTFFVAENTEQLAEQLQKLPFGKNKIKRGERASCIFLFPGQGAQYTDMGLGLYQNWEVFRDLMDECFQIYSDITGNDIKQIIYPDQGQPDYLIHQTRYTQPSIFMIEYCIARFLLELGVEPDIMIGHSLGEYTCACISGVFSLRDAISLIISRAELTDLIMQGSMLSVQSDVETVKEFLTDQISLACINTPMNCVLSGPTEIIEKLGFNLEKRGIRNQIIKTSHAFHSSMMDPILDTFKERIENINFSNPSVPYISTLTGLLIEQDDVNNPDYWVRHMRETVSFSAGITQILEQVTGEGMFIEVGPGNTLTSFVKQITLNRDSNFKYIQTLRHPLERSSDERFFLKTIGHLWKLGVNIHWESLHDEAKYKISLPTYAFQKEQFEINDKQMESIVERVIIDIQKKTNKKSSNISNWFYLPVWRQKPVLNSGVSDSEVSEQTILFFDSHDALSEETMKLLSKSHTVINVLQNNKFIRNNRLSYSIKPDDDQQYNELMECLTSDGYSVDMVINMWPTNPEAYIETIPTAEQIFNNQFNSFYNLLYIIKAIRKVSRSSSIFLNNVTVELEDINGEENIQVQSAPALSALKTLSQEFPTVKVKNIDISPIPNYKVLGELLTNEFFSGNDDNEIAFRGKKRYIKAYEQVSVPKPLQSQIRVGGTYIITGGLGSIGRKISKYLIDNYNAKVIVTTRRRDNELSNGTNLSKRNNIFIESVDITDLEDLSQMVKRVETVHGSVHGVIHAAGKTDGFMFIDTDEADVSYYSEFHGPKVTGLLNLHHIFKNRQLDFFLGMSSLSVIAGGLTYCAYSAANIFMDYFMHKVSKPNWISVDWSAWVGETTDASNNIGQEMKQIAVQTDEGMELLERILTMNDCSQVIQYAGDLPELTKQWLQVRNYNNEEETFKQVKPFIMPEDQEKGKVEVEKLIRKIWEEHLVIEGIETDTSFFDLGGDSLKALSMVDMLNRKFKVELSLNDFFNAQTIEKMTDLVRVLMKDQTTTATSLMKVEKKTYFDVTSSQKRLYVINQSDPDGLAYNQPLALEIKGKIEPDKLEKAFIRLIERHESLRTVFNMVEGTIKQNVLDEFVFELKYLKVDYMAVEDTIRQVIQPFDLKTTPLIRATLLQTEIEKYVLVMDLHHIITDLVTSHIILRDLMNLYYDVTLESVPIQYKDYAISFSTVESKQKMEKQRQFWMETLDGQLPILDIPSDFPRPSQRSMRGEVACFSLTLNESKAIKQYVNKQNITLFSLMLSAYSIFLSKVCNTDDLVIGLPVNGRNNRQLMNTVGLFINTLPVRLLPSSDKLVTDYMREVQSNLFLALDNRDYPFDDLVNELSTGRDPSRNPIFDTMFNMLSSDFMDGTESIASDKKLEINQYDFHQKTSMFDISFIIEVTDRINIKIEFSTDLFLQDTINRMYVCYKNALMGISGGGYETIGDLKITSEEEQFAICNQFNNIPKDELDETIISIFRNTACQHTDVPAIVAEGIELTYGQLDIQSDALACYLSNQEIGTDSIVPIFVDRSVYTVISLLSVIKVGAAYLPINPEHPKKRIQTILEQSNAKLILNPSSNILANDFGVPVINPRQSLYYSRDSLAAVNMNADQAAYVIFTSGTTGDPKGIVVTHKNVINLVKGIKSHVLNDNNEIQRVSLLASFEFDASVQQIFTALLSGKTLFIANAEEKNSGGALVEFYNKNQIQLSDATPIHIHLLTQSDQAILPFLKLILVGGETLTGALVERFYQHYIGQEALLVNVYGPTECCVDVTYYPIERDSARIKETIIPIGKPLPNQTVYVLDPNMHLQPIGVYGEIHVGGLNVSSGYLNQDILNKKNFVDNPFHPGKLYKTGDYGRWDKEGNLHFYGRRDGQIKKNGYRIELSDIDSSMMKHGLVDGSASVLKTSGNKDSATICTYYISDQNIDEKNLRSYLAELLPYYSIPDHFVRLEKFPVTSNGKLNYKEFPEPHNSTYYDLDELPVHPNEAILLKLWREALNNESIERNTGFFNIGGNSINMIQIISGLLNFGLKVTMRDFYLYNTIEQLAPHLTNINNIQVNAAEGQIQLTPIQSRFFELHRDHKNHFNQSILLKLNKNVQKQNIQNILSTLVQHHDTLRITFDINSDNTIYQKYKQISKENERLLFYRIGQDHSIDTEILTITKDVQQKIQLNGEQLYAVAFIEGPLEDYLFISIHHLLIDTVSWHFFLKDLDELLSQDEESLQLTLGNKSNTYQQWSELLNDYARSEKFSSEKQYWIELNEQTHSHSSTEQKVHLCEEELQSESLLLSKSQTTALLMEANDAYQTTIEELLLSALALSLQDLLDKNEIVISLEAHGRQDLFDRYDFTKTMGWFTVIFPFVLNMFKTGHITDQIMTVKNNLRSVPNKGIGYGICRYLLNGIQEDKLFEPDIGFQYLGELDGKRETFRHFAVSDIRANNDHSSDTKAEFNLLFTVFIRDEMLKVKVDYNTVIFKKEEIKRLVENLQQFLTDIILHCAEMIKKGGMYREFDYKGLSTDMLDEIIQDIEV